MNQIDIKCPINMAMPLHTPGHLPECIYVHLDLYPYSCVHVSTVMWSYIYIHENCHVLACLQQLGETYFRCLICNWNQRSRQGATCTCSSEICMWSLLIQQFDDACDFPNATFALLKYHLCIEIVQYLNITCQGSNHHMSGV
jgi:hypothetical protein